MIEEKVDKLTTMLGHPVEDVTPDRGCFIRELLLIVSQCLLNS